MQTSRRCGPLVILSIALLAVSAGCRPPEVTFPEKPLTADAKQIAYDTDGDGKADCLFLLDTSGRIARMGLDRREDPNGERVIDLDKLPVSRCRHVVIILDGVGYDLVRQYYADGHLRMFHPPSRVIAPYPTLTDLCFEDFLGLGPVAGMEAEYYNREKNDIVGGSGNYLDADELPYNRVLNYRADTTMDALCYLYPESVFRKDINDAKRLIDRRETKEVLVYLVSSAGLGTIEGKAGHLHALAGVERLVSQLLVETDGLCKFTILSDHGHTYTPAKRIAMEAHLKEKGWNIRDHLNADRDVAYVRFGLETYLSLSGKHPAELAADAVTCPGAEIASYADGNSVVVLDHAGGRAVIRRKGDTYSYTPSAGDPLKLRDVLGKPPAGTVGYYDANETFAATYAAEYPAPLQRLWRAHFGIVENPPDVIVSLANDYFSGSTALAGFVKVASTHGGLNKANSTAFIMSTIAPLPDVMRSKEIPAQLTLLTGRHWPWGE